MLLLFVASVINYIFLLLRKCYKGISVALTILTAQKVVPLFWFFFMVLLLVEICRSRGNWLMHESRLIKLRDSSIKLSHHRNNRACHMRAWTTIKERNSRKTVHPRRIFMILNTNFLNHDHIKALTEMLKTKEPNFSCKTLLGI